MRRGALISIHSLLRRKKNNVDIMYHLISVQCFLEVDYFRVSCSQWPIYSMDARGRTAYIWAKPFPLIQTRESRFRSPLISQSIIGTTQKSRGALLAHSDLVSFPFNPPGCTQADNHPSCSSTSSFTLEELRREMLPA